jgi:hypothetical protein
MFVAPPGYTPPKAGSTVVIKEARQDLVIGAAGLSRSQLGALVTSGLRSAA